MDVVFQGLAPRMQDHGDPEFPAEPRGVTPEGLQGGRGGLKQEALEESGVALGEGVQGMGQGKHAVEVRDGQQVTETRFHPAHFRQRLALGTVPVLARVIAAHLGATGVALRSLPPQRGGPTGDDVWHSPALAARQAMPLLVGAAMRAKDVGDLYLLRGLVPGVRPGTHGLLLPKAEIIQQCQRRRCLEEMAPSHV
jgi:hypothetical protein